MIFEHRYRVNYNHEVLIMDSMFNRNIQKKPKKGDPHISGVAAALFGILLIMAVLGALSMDGRVPDL